MQNYKSEDLLLKSQLLISKFRKQREASRQKQSAHIPSYHNNSISEYLSLQQLHKFSPRNTADLSSNVSVWSDGPPSPINEINTKKDCGINTEPDDEVLTPITALPTIRTSRQPAPEINTMQSHKYASICTEVAENQDVESDPPQPDVMPPAEPVRDEDSQIGMALNLYQEEKRLEEDIASKEAEIMEITNEMLRMVEKIDMEKNKLEKMKIKKQEMCEKRLQIFTGLTQQIQQKLQMPTSPSNTAEFNESQPHKLTQENISLIQSNNAIYNLDKKTISKIITKVIDNDVSCTDDDELMTQFIQSSSGQTLVNSNQFFSPIRQSFPETNNSALKNTIEPQEELSDCILSDVMSLKDLQVSSAPRKASSASRNSHLSTRSTATIVNNYRPPLSLRTAQSMDNLTASKRKRRTNSYRNNIRSPTVSEGHRVPRQPTANHHQNNLFTDDSSDTM